LILFGSLFCLVATIQFVFRESFGNSARRDLERLGMDTLPKANPKRTKVLGVLVPALLFAIGVAVILLGVLSGR
jgi:hypothetical protein